MRSEYYFSKGKRGAVVASPGKTQDNDVIEHFRVRAEAAGSGYQTEINRILREHMVNNGELLTLDALRRVIREELHAA